jgi:hypothetical protein
MKWFGVFLLLLLFVFGCTARSVRQTRFAANGKMQGWDVKPVGDDWVVTIWYDILNTGSLEIIKYNVHVTIDVEGSKTVIADCWGPSKTVDEYRAKKLSAPISPGNTERCVVVLDIPYKPMRVSIALAEFK